jgi:hypothetical protein
VYDPTTKKVFLVADNIPNNAQAAITLAHESLGHFSLRAVLGTNFKPMMNQIYEGNKSVRERADAYMEEGLDRETAVEEVLSEMAQEVYDTSVPESKLRPTRTALQKIMNAVRQFLARIGVPIKTIDDAAVLALIANARRSVVRGEGVAGEMAGGKSLYSAATCLGNLRSSATPIAVSRATATNRAIILICSSEGFATGISASLNLIKSVVLIRAKPSR